jgi:UDPglucose 6-dehydrogenase
MPSAWPILATTCSRSTSTRKRSRGPRGEAPFFEPGLEPLLRKNLDAGRLRFTVSFAEVGRFGEVHFLCVGTPEGESGRADLGTVYGAA